MTVSSASNASAVSLENLRRGIAQRFDYDAKKGQSDIRESVFKFAFYQKLEKRRATGLNQDFWRFLVPELRKWRALRTSKPGITNEFIVQEGIKRLPALQGHFDTLCAKGPKQLPAVDSVQWSHVAPLFVVAHEIKGKRSPMFASKVCNFLVPSAYFIWDNKLVKGGWNDYRKYWDDCQVAWVESPQKEALKQEIHKHLPADTVPCSTFPWSTMITELCQTP
jgi:hypothetical protein